MLTDKAAELRKFPRYEFDSIRKSNIREFGRWAFSPFLKDGGGGLFPEICRWRGPTKLRRVRLQMVWDNLSCLGTEALARLGLRLGGFQLMLQSSLSDGVAFDPFSFQKDGSASAEVDVGRCEVL